jgi:hypothetical protein
MFIVRVTIATTIQTQTSDMGNSRNQRERDGNGDWLSLRNLFAVLGGREGCDDVAKKKPN